MLEMDERRLNYSDQLRPEEGFEVVYAVGTTYSLDMAAMLNVTLSLGLGEVSNSAMQDNDICLFTAVEKMTKKMTVFCEQGRIKAGDKANPLCVLFEDMISQVVVSKKRMLSSFHPKVWVVEYANPKTKEHKWRLLVLSRNLTFDTSWDVAVRLDGKVTEQDQRSSEPIVEFLRYLSHQISNENARAQSSIRKMANRLEKVQFDIESRDFDEFEFMPLGPGLHKAAEAPLFKTSHNNAIIISPFVSETGPLEILAHNRTSYGQREGTFALVARDYQLAKLPDSILSKYQLFVPDPFLASVDLDGGASSANYADLHAKVYFTDSGTERNLYVGSLNASYNGLSNNVECLLRLHAKKRKVMLSDLMKSLVGTDTKNKGPFLQTDQATLVQQAFEDEEGQRIDAALHKLAKHIEFAKAQVTKDEDNTFAIKCHYSLGDFKGDSDISFSIAPYLADGAAQTIDLQASSHTHHFGHLKLKQVSGFFTLVAKSGSGETGSCVVKVPSDLFDDVCAPLEDRTKKLVETILDNDSSALALYIDLAFHSHSAGYHAASSKTGENAWSTSQVIGSGLYERLLVASLEEPHVLETASMLINLIPEKYEEERIHEMRSMIDSFKKAVGSNAR